MTLSVEKRRFHRVPMELPLEFTLRDSWQTAKGLGKDISLGGMFIETASLVSFGAAILVRIALPNQRTPLIAPATVRWVSENGMGIQFGLLGARETHIITQLGGRQ